MVLEAIYVTRHGHRLSWTVNPKTGEYRMTMPTPTGIPSDPILAAHGERQASELAAHVVTLTPRIDAIYSSPFYRCLQTLKPTMAALRTHGRDLRVRVENGLGDFFGTAHFHHPGPAPLEELQEYFDFLDSDYKPVVIPYSKGESAQTIHDRHAYALARIIQRLDSEPGQPKVLLISTHAASMICIGRALTGAMPDDTNTDDFRCGTCSLSKYVRRKPSHTGVESLEEWNPSEPQKIPHVDWRRGMGVAGGWDCELNGDCSHLTQGEERSWHFQGDESFIDFDEEGSTNEIKSNKASRL